jgi:hypothetical protein
MTAKPTGGESKDTSAQIVEFALEESTELFVDRSGRPHVTIDVDGALRTFRIRDRSYKHRLAHRYYCQEGRVPPASALADALGVLEGHALHSGVVHDVFIRVGGSEEEIFIDLGRDDGLCVQVTGEGWTLTFEVPVRFRRPRGLQEMPVPEEGGSIEPLRHLLNLEADGDFILVVSWTVQALMPKGPFPILVLQGQQGSAKSMTTRLLRRLIDPNTAPTRGYPQNQRDLMIAASNSCLLTYDNLSGVPNWLSDALCRLSTGGGFVTRELYTDDDEVLIDAQRPIILNGIGPIPTRGDLADRSIVLELQSIPPSARRPESEMLRYFEQVVPTCVGALLDALSMAIRRRHEVLLADPPRMADFARTGASIERAFGWPDGAFIQAYRTNLGRAAETVLDASPIARYVVAHGRDGRRGTAKSLLELIEKEVPDQELRHPDWPKSPLVFSNLLRRLAPALAAAGVQVIFGEREGRRGDRIMKWVPIQ